MISGIPDEVTLAYLQKHEVSIENVNHFREVTENTVEWATALTQRIVSGTDLKSAKIEIYY